MTAPRPSSPPRPISAPGSPPITRPPPELLVGFWKKASGRPSIDWPQARDQALCFGWIDGVRKSLGEDSYTIRFTPRRKGSIWSRVNVARYDALTAGRADEAGGGSRL